MELATYQLNELAQEIYRTHERIVIPNYPYILVAVLPKEQAPLGTIILAEKTNKVMYEGIVLATWEPFTREIREGVHNLTDEGPMVPALTEFDGTYKTAVFESALEVGDHVLFPHFEGQPVPFMNGPCNDGFRLVREFCPSEPKIQICAKIAREKKPDADLVQLLKYISHTVHQEDGSAAVKRLNEEYYVIRRKQSSVTVTGK